MKKVIIFFLFLLFFHSISFAEDNLSLCYNIFPDNKNFSVIDIKEKNILKFSLVEDIHQAIYCNNSEIPVINKSIRIDISNMSGRQEFIFTNDMKESAIFVYYISNNNGLVADYNLTKNSPTYIKTVNGISLLYTEQDSFKMNLVTSILNNIPIRITSNLKSMTFLPYENSTKAAGITCYDKVTFYNIFQYSDKTIKRIIYHEIAHTWAHELRKNGILDYSYSDFKKAIVADKSFVTTYSKSSPSEDFADSISLYFINSDSFEKKYKFRSAYIKMLLSAYSKLNINI